MNISVERLRRWMLVAAGLLVLVIAAYLIARNRVQRALTDKAKEVLHDLGVDIISTTDNFTISQSGGADGKTIYTIHASREITHRNGQMTLHDVAITLYGRKHDREDHISGAEFQYDQQAGTISAAGEVHIDLQPPARAGKPAPKPAHTTTTNGEDPSIIHVRTSGLIFWQKMGLAATREPLDFHVQGITGSAIGAEYSSDTGLLVLQSQVRAAGLANGRPVQLSAAHAELNRSTERAVLQQVHYAGQRPGSPNIEKASADEATILMRQDGTAQHIDAIGNVILDPAPGATIHSAKLAVDLNPDSQPQQLFASGGVQYARDEPLRKAQGSSSDARVWFAPHGIAQRLLATGKVQLNQRTHAAAADPWLSRSLAGDQVDVAFAPIPGSKQVQVSTLQSSGNARVVTQSTAAQKPGAQPVTTTTTLAANRIDSRLLGTPDGLAHLHGEGSAQMQQTSSDGSQQDNHGDTMDVAFRPQPPRTARSTPADSLTGLVSASLLGHVTIAQTPARKPGDTKPPVTGHGSANRADYSAAQDRLILTDKAQWSSAGRTVWASQISTDRSTGDADAQGGVAVSIVKEGAPAGADITHVVADHARIHQATQSAEFFGAATPARMWQGVSQVEAPALLLDQAQQRLTARSIGTAPQVHSTFEGMKTPKSGGRPKAEVVRIASHDLVYSDVTRVANFSGGVQVESADGSMTAQRADAWLQPAAAAPQLTGKSPQPAVKSTSTPAAGTGMFSGSVDHILATGRVRLTQPGRHGAGEQLTYTAADQKFVLTGTPTDPPIITDQRGTSTGASLIFHAGDDSVEISGTPPGSSAQGVHTETRVNPRTRQP